VDGTAGSAAGDIAKLRGRLDDLLSAISRADGWANGAAPDDVRALLETIPRVVERITEERTALVANSLAVLRAVALRSNADL